MGKNINLLDYKKRGYSKIGNDGIIEYIFKILNIKEGTFVEFGAWDGLFKCNCRKLFEEGWTGIFIESDKKRYKKLKVNYKKSKNIQCINKKVKLQGSNLFDTIVDPYLNGQNIDFCVIDIDGLDLDVFETFEKYLPTVVCIEGGQMFHPLHDKIEQRKIIRKGIQQSLKIINDSFEQRGYKILCSCQDCFFVKKEFYHLFNVSSDLLTLYFDGLRAVYRRIPYIQKYFKNVGLKNYIIDYILENTLYKEYGWEKRNIWTKEKKDIIKKFIDKAEKIERNK